MKLSPNFTLQEAIHTHTGLPNGPTPEIIARLRNSAKGMEEIRSLLGDLPIRVHSAYRCDAVNKAVGGSPKSDHRNGDAWDFDCDEYGTPYKICKDIEKSGIEYDQLIQEGTWVHFSRGPRMRQEALTKVVADNGKINYVKGISSVA